MALSSKRQQAVYDAINGLSSSKNTKTNSNSSKNSSDSTKKTDASKNYYQMLNNSDVSKQRQYNVFQALRKNNIGHDNSEYANVKDGSELSKPSSMLEIADTIAGNKMKSSNSQNKTSNSSNTTSNSSNTISSSTSNKNTAKKAAKSKNAQIAENMLKKSKEAGSSGSLYSLTDIATGSSMLPGTENAVTKAAKKDNTSKFGQTINNADTFKRAAELANKQNWTEEERDEADEIRNSFNEMAPENRTMLPSQKKSTQLMSEDSRWKDVNEALKTGYHNVLWKNPESIYDTANTYSKEERDAAVKNAESDRKNPLTKALTTEVNGDTDKKTLNDIKKYTYMTDDQKRRYNEIYSLYGKKEAEEYHEILLNQINETIANEQLANNPELQNKFGKAAYMFTEGAASGINGVGELVKGALGDKTRKASDVSEYVASDIRNNENNSTIDNAVYDIAQSTGYMAPGMLLSGGLGAVGTSAKFAETSGNLLFGLAQAGNTYRSDINEGKSYNSAMLHAGQQGVDESATNWLLGGINAFGGGAIKKVLGNSKAGQALSSGLTGLAKTQSGKVVLQRAADALTDMGSEAAQEYLQFYTENLTNNLLYGNTESLDPMDPDAWYAAALGALNAGILNLPNNVVRTAQGINADVSHAAQTAESLDLDRSHYNSDEDFEKVETLKAVADEVAQKVADGTVGITDKIAYNEAVSDVLASEINIENNNNAAENEDQKQEQVQVRLLPVNYDESAVTLGDSINEATDQWKNILTNPKMNSVTSTDGSTSYTIERSGDTLYFTEEAEGETKAQKEYAISDIGKGGNADILSVMPIQGTSETREIPQLTTFVNYAKGENIDTDASRIENTNVNGLSQETTDIAESYQNESAENRVSESVSDDGLSSETIENNNNNTDTSSDAFVTKENFPEYSKQYSAELSTKESTDNMINLWNGRNASEYLSAYKRVYTAGFNNVDQATAERAITNSYLTPAQWQQAYKDGMRDGNAKRKASREQTYKKGEARKGGITKGEELVDEDKAKFLNWVGNKTGLKIQIAEGLKGEAEINVEKGIMRINPYAKDFVGSTAHELTHMLKIYAPNEYSTLERLTVEALMKSKEMDYETLYNSYEEVYRKENSDYTSEDIVEEMVADGATAYMNDAEFVENVVKADRSLAKKIADFFKEIADTLKQIINEKGIRTVGKVMCENEARFRMAANTWAKALTVASEKYKEGYTIETEDGERYQIKEFKDGTRYIQIETDQEQFNGLNEEELKHKAREIINDKFAGNIIGYKENTPIVETKRGAKEYAYSQKRNQGKAETNAKLRASTELDNLLNVSKYIGSASYESVKNKHPEALGGFDYYKTIFSLNGKDFFEGTVNVMNQKKVRTLYDITKIKNISQNGILRSSFEERGRIGDAKNKTNKWLSQNRLQLPLAITHFDLTQKIPQGIQNSKGILKVNSEGNSLTTEQAKYFANSKVVDANGNLKVMYHQTANDFTVFDPDHRGAGTNDHETPNGIFIKPNNDDIGVSGSKQMELYANITNPLEFTDRSAASRYWKKHIDGYDDLLKKLNDTDAKYQEKYEALDEEDEATYRELWNKHKNKEISDEEYERRIDEASQKEQKLLDEWKEATDNTSVRLKGMINDYMLNSEYDGVHLKKDAGSFGRDVETWIALKPEQVKSISNENPTENSDIRFQLGLDPGENASRQQLEEAEYRNFSDNMVRSSNRELQDATESLSTLLSSVDYMPSDKAIERTAKRIKKYTETDTKVEDIIPNLKTIFNYIAYNDKIDGASISDIAADYAGDLISNNSKLKVDPVEQELYKRYRNAIKGYTFHMPEGFEGEVEALGGIGKLRKQFFGTLNITKNKGVSIDTMYQELAELYPDMFDADRANPADQLEDIIDKLSNAPKADVSYKTEADYDAFRYYAGQEIFKAYIAEGAAEAGARSEYQSLKREFNKKMKASEKTETEMAALQSKATEMQSKYLSELEASKKKVTRQTMNDRVKEARQSTKLRYHKDQIIKNTKELSRWLLKPTDKNHVPEALRTPLATFLQQVDFSSKENLANGDPTQRTLLWQNLTNAWAKIANNGGVAESENGTQYIDVDPDIVAKMEELTTKVRDMKRMEDLDYIGVLQLSDVIKSMKHSIENANELMSTSHYKTVAEAAESTLTELGKMKTSKDYTGVIGVFERLFTNEMLDASTRFHTFGTAAEDVYKGLRKSFNKKVKRTAEAANAFKQILKDAGVTSKEMNKWSSGKDSNLIKITTERGVELKLTVAQVMSLYELMQRNQAKDHILTGGITSSAVNVETKFLKIINTEKRNKTGNVKVTQADVLNLIDQLTPEQKKVADGITAYFQQTAQWGNNASFQMYGYKKFNDPHYFPIQVDRNYLTTTSDAAAINSDAVAIKNMGLTKSTVPHANNPLVLSDIFDVFTNQVNDMSNYEAFLVPLSDLQKWYNFKDSTQDEKFNSSIKKELERVFGSEAHSFINKFMKNINGMKDGERYAFKGLVSAFKGASVGANLSVAIQQPTAYARAMAVIDPKYLLKALTTKAEAGSWEDIKKHSSIAQWKEWGFYETDIGRSMKNILTDPDTLLDKAKELQMAPAGKGDEIAWKRLWVAAELKVKDEQPELTVGSDKFYEAVSDVFDDVIDRTQVVDSVFHRTDIMRSTNDLTLMTTAFMAEPMKSYNMLYRAGYDLIFAKDAKERKSAGVTLARSGMAFLLSNALAAMAKSIITSMRDKDDDRDEAFWKRWEKHSGEEFLGNILAWNNTPFVKDIVSIFQGYDVSRTDLTGFQDLYYAISRWNKLLNGESKYTIGSNVLYTTKAISDLTGLALYGLQRDFNAVIDTICEALGADDLYYQKQKLVGYDIGNKNNAGYYIGMAMKEYSKGHQGLGDKIIHDMVDAGIAQETIDTKLKNYAKETVESDDEFAKMLDDTASTGKLDLSSYKEKLKSEGYSDDTIDSVISSQINSYMDDNNLSYKALNEELNKISDYTNSGYADYKELYTKWSNLAKAKNGWDDNKCRQQFRSQCTQYFKPLYQAGDAKEKSRILNILSRAKTNKGTKIYDKESDIKKWGDK